MDINDGRFSMNGGCGYVLKPNFIRDDVGLYFASNIFFYQFNRSWILKKLKLSASAMKLVFMAIKNEEAFFFLLEFKNETKCIGGIQNLQVSASV